MPDSNFGSGTFSAATPQIRRMTSPITKVNPKVTIRNALPSRPYSRRSIPSSKAAPMPPTTSGASTSAPQKLPVTCTAE
jgi:hypothetical protein